MAPLGLSPNFVLLPCDYLDNAAAVTYEDGIRYIIYNRAFMIKIGDSSGDWASLGIVAHEIGHHLQGHTTRKLSFPPSREELRLSRMHELEADEFSGFMMYKLGATLEQAQRAMASMGDVRDEELSTHPKKFRRMAAIEKGFKRAEGQYSIGVDGVEKLPSAEELYSKGNDAFENNDYDKAIGFFSAAIAANPNYSGAYFRRAFSKSELKDIKGAIDDYTTAIRLKPDYISAYYNRGIIRSQIKDDTGAIEDYTAAIRLQPDDAAAHYGRAISKFAIKDYTGAIEDYTDAIRLQPDYAPAYKNRGHIRFHLKDFTGACEDFRNSCRLGSEGGCTALKSCKQ